MAIKFDIHSIPNAAGKGTPQAFVRLLPEQKLSLDELADRIQRSSTVTRADILAVLSDLRQVATEQLSSRGSFYLPEIGYFTLQAATHPTEAVPVERLKGDFISVRNIKFRPEQRFLQQVRQRTHFVRLKGSTLSADYSEAELRQKISDYLAQGDGTLTAKALRLHFGLSRYKTEKWLEYFVSTGFLKKTGSRHSPVYLR